MLKEILVEISKETESQTKKFGLQRHHPQKWMVILGEEYGEACSETLAQIQSGYRAELIQIAAVSVQAIISHDLDLLREGNI